MSLEIKIKEMRVTPVAIADPPLRSSYGLHQPYALRNILEFESEELGQFVRGQVECG